MTLKTKPTKEQRDIVLEMGDSAVNGYLDFERAWAVIGKAIRAAQNDTLEQAVRACREMMIDLPEQVDPYNQIGAHNGGCIDCMTAINGLKHPAAPSQPETEGGEG